MRDLRIRQYKESDFLEIDAPEGEKKARVDLNVAQLAKYHELAGPAMTILADNGDIVACTGVSILWPGAGEAWLVVCRSIKKYIRFLHVCKIGIEQAQKAHNLKRIQAIIDPERKGTVKMVEHLGFEFEGRLKYYGPKGVDKCMYALTEE